MSEGFPSLGWCARCGHVADHKQRGRCRSCRNSFKGSPSRHPGSWCLGQRYPPKGGRDPKENHVKT